MKKSLLVTFAIAGVVLLQSCSTTEFAAHIKGSDLQKVKPAEQLVKAEPQKLNKINKLVAEDVKVIDKEESILVASNSKVMTSPILHRNTGTNNLSNTSIELKEQPIVTNHFNKKEWKAQLKKMKKDSKQSGGSNLRVDQALIIILAIIVPPIGVLVYDDGIETAFWISLILTLIFWFPGAIYSVLHVLGEV